MRSINLKQEIIMPLLEKIFAIGNYNNANELAIPDKAKYDSNYEEYLLSYYQYQRQFIIQINTADMYAFHNGAGAPVLMQERKQIKIAKKLEDELIAVGLRGGDYTVSVNSKYITLNEWALASFRSKLITSFNNWSVPIGSLLLIRDLYDFDPYVLQKILSNEGLHGQILSYEYNTSIYGSHKHVFYVTNGIFDENGNLIGEAIGKHTAQLIIEAFQVGLMKFGVGDELQVIEYSEAKGGPKHGIALAITSVGLGKLFELAGIGIHSKPIRSRRPRAIPAVIAGSSKTQPAIPLAPADITQKTTSLSASYVSSVPTAEAATVGVTEQIAKEDIPSFINSKDEPISAAPAFTPEFEQKLTHLQLGMSLNIAEKLKIQEQINLLDEQVFNQYLDKQPPKNLPIHSEKQQLLDTVKNIITANTNLKVVTALYAYINQAEHRNILNVHANPIRDRLTFTHNTSTFKDLLDEIRRKSYSLLFQQLGIKMGIADSKGLHYTFNDAQYAMDIINQFIGEKIFAQHHSNYFVLNFFHNTGHVTILENLREDCIQQLGNKSKGITL